MRVFDAHKHEAQIAMPTVPTLITMSRRHQLLIMFFITEVQNVLFSIYQYHVLR